MATTNPVFNVLATSGNQALLAAGNRVTDLANGQIGVFDYHTGLSVNGSVPATCKDIFLAVGINRTTGGTDPAQDISKSAGQMIQVRHARALTVKGYVAQIEKVVAVTDFIAKCDTDYAIKLTVSSPANSQINGYNSAAKTFAYRTACCTDDCDTCAKGDCTELALGMVNAINSGGEGIFSASLFANKLLATIGDPTTDGTATIGLGTEKVDVALLAADNATQAAAKIAAAINASTVLDYTASSSAAVLTVYPKRSLATNTAMVTLVATGGTGVTVGTTSNTNVAVATTDVAAFKAAYPNTCLSIKITTIAQSRAGLGDTNNKYNKSGIDFQVSLVDGFDCNGTVTTLTALQYLEGKGYDIKMLERVAAGWGKPGPYRTNAITGLPNSVESFLSDTANYNVVSIAYDIESVGGWEEYKNNLETIIAIPCADGTTLTGLFAVLDLIFTQFGAMTNDVAAMDCTNTNTSTINDPTLDGIESLA